MRAWACRQPASTSLSSGARRPWRPPSRRARRTGGRGSPQDRPQTRRASLRPGTPPPPPAPAPALAAATATPRRSSRESVRPRRPWRGPRARPTCCVRLSRTSRGGPRRRCPFSRRTPRPLEAPMKMRRRRPRSGPLSSPRPWGLRPPAASRARTGGPTTPELALGSSPPGIARCVSRATSGGRGTWPHRWAPCTTQGRGAGSRRLRRPRPPSLRRPCSWALGARRRPRRPREGSSRGATPRASSSRP